MRRWVKLVVLALHSFWLPQIVSCARHDARQPLTPAYVLGMSASRLALPLYLHGCPHNLLRVPPSPRFCAALVLYVAAQARRPPCQPPPRCCAAAHCCRGMAGRTYAVGSVVLAQAVRCCRWLRPAARR